MMSQNDTVWPVYDRLRSARLSVKYYCCRLQQAERTSFSLDVLLLAVAPTSAVAGLWFWTTDIGHFLWQALASVSAFAAVIKPLLHLTKKIKDYESLVSGYRILEYDLLEIKIAIEQKKRFDAAMQAEFKRIQQRERTLIGKISESRENKRIKRICEAEVIQELPAEAFFVPED